MERERLEPSATVVFGTCRREPAHPNENANAALNRGGVLFQAAVSAFATVPAGQNFLPLIRIGGGKIPASVQRSIVRMETRCRSATMRVGSSAAAGRSAAGSRI
jgi:hypothetical protein